MKTPTKAYALLLFSSGAGVLLGQEWTEAQVIDRFQNQSPYAREIRARVDAARADAAGRSLLPNPSGILTREGAGFTSFFQLEQQAPWSGRLGLLKQAGTAAVLVTQAEAAAALRSIHSDVRAAFYRMLAAQRKQSVLTDGLRDLDGVIAILRKRESEGEGSRYDRLRAERESADHRAQLALSQTEIVQARSVLNAFLADGPPIDRVAGVLNVESPIPAVDVLVLQALSRRLDYLSEQRQIERYALEERAAGRLRIPEPTIVIGGKRAEVAAGDRQTSTAIAVTVPLPLFNRGQTEVARFRAEQQAAMARRDALDRRIRAEVAGTAELVRLRRVALEQYRREVEQLGGDLSRIVRVAYDEGEVGILELLDSYRVTRQAQLRLVELEALVREALIDLDRAVGEEVLP
jgi:cobalt-zinc-cadmium efflux system outer membrane protein